MQQKRQCGFVDCILLVAYQQRHFVPNLQSRLFKLFFALNYGAVLKVIVIVALVAETLTNVISKFTTLPSLRV